MKALPISEVLFLHILYWVIILKYRRYYRNRGATVFRTVCLIIILLTAFLLLDAKLRPAIYDLAALEAGAVSSRTVNEAVEAILTKNAPVYSEIVNINYAENNVITGITTDIVKMNLFKSKVSKAVDDAFKRKNKTEITVSAGTASGLTLLSGLGPYIDVDVGFASSTQSDFENIFTSAGINQTQHNVMLNIETTVILTLPGKRVEKTVETSFCVAQTVIVGTVPDVVVNG